MTLTQMSGSAAVMIAVILLLRRCAMDKLPKRTFVALWDLTLLRLLLPARIPFPTSIYNLLRHTSTAGSGVSSVLPVATLPVPESTGSSVHFSVIPSEAAATLAERYTAVNADVIPVLWGIVAGAMALAFLVTYWQEYRRFSTSLPDHNDYADWWRKLHPLIRRYEIRTYRSITSPLTYGVFRPVILLPEKMNRYTEEQLNCILTHEWTHIRRFDAVRKMLLTAALCLHWFNPLVWVMYYRMNQDMELACDENVLRLGGLDSRKRYALTLIELEEKRSGLMPVYNSFSKNALEERVRAIMGTHPYRRAFIAAAVVLVLGVAVVFGTTGQQTLADPLEGYQSFSVSIHSDRFPENDSTVNYSLDTRTEDGKAVLDILSKYHYFPTLGTLRTMATQAYTYPSNELPYLIDIQAIDLPVGAAASHSTYLNFGGGGTVLLDSSTGRLASYHIGGFGSRDGYALMQELHDYLETYCQEPEELRYGRIVQDFLERIYTTDRLNRYTDYLEQVDGLDDPAALTEALSDYYAATGLQRITTEELFQTMMANRLPMKYDKYYAENPQSPRSIGTAHEDRYAPGHFDYTVDLFDRDGSKTVRLRGSIDVDLEAGVVTKFSEGTP